MDKDSNNEGTRRTKLCLTDFNTFGVKCDKQVTTHRRLDCNDQKDGNQLRVAKIWLISWKGKESGMTGIASLRGFCYFHSFALLSCEIQFESGECFLLNASLFVCSLKIDAL